MTETKQQPLLEAEFSTQEEAIDYAVNQAKQQGFHLNPGRFDKGKMARYISCPYGTYAYTTRKYVPVGDPKKRRTRENHQTGCLNRVRIRFLKKKQLWVATESEALHNHGPNLLEGDALEAYNKEREEENEGKGKEDGEELLEGAVERKELRMENEEEMEERRRLETILGDQMDQLKMLPLPALKEIISKIIAWKLEAATSGVCNEATLDILDMAAMGQTSSSSLHQHETLAAHTNTTPHFDENGSQHEMEQPNFVVEESEAVDTTGNAGEEKNPGSSGGDVGLEMQGVGSVRLGDCGVELGVKDGKVWHETLEVSSDEEQGSDVFLLDPEIRLAIQQLRQERALRPKLQQIEIRNKVKPAFTIPNTRKRGSRYQDSLMVTRKRAKGYQKIQAGRKAQLKLSKSKSAPETTSNPLATRKSARNQSTTPSTMPSKQPEVLGDSEDPVLVGKEVISKRVVPQIPRESWIQMQRDGNCGYRAISRFLSGTQNNWMEIRRQLLDTLNNNSDKYLSLYHLKDGQKEFTIEEYRESLDWFNKGQAPGDTYLSDMKHFQLVADRYNVFTVMLVRTTGVCQVYVPEQLSSKSEETKRAMFLNSDTKVLGILHEGEYDHWDFLDVGKAGLREYVLEMGGFLNVEHLFGVHK